jgi:hypothetical protein
LQDILDLRPEVSEIELIIISGWGNVANGRRGPTTTTGNTKPMESIEATFNKDEVRIRYPSGTVVL